MSDLRLHIASDPAVKAGQAEVGDLDVSSGGAVLVDGIAAVRQHVLMRLQFFQGEWFLDRRVGIPYRQSILEKLPNTNVVASLLREAIATTPGIVEVQNFLLDYDRPTRTLTVQFEARAEGFDDVLSFDEELILI